MTDFISYSSIIEDFNNLNQKSPFILEKFDNNVNKNDYLNLLTSLDNEQKINLINYSKQISNSIFLEFLENYFFYNNPNYNLIVFYILEDEKYILEDKKYFIKKIYDPYESNNHIRNTCELISIMIENDDNDPNNYSINAIPIHNIRLEIFNYILEFLKYYYKYPWHSINKPLIKDDFKDNIIYKYIIKYIEEDSDDINNYIFWDESHKYIIYQKKSDDYPDDKLFSSYCEIHRIWFADWIHNIYQRDINILYEIVNASNFLDIKPLLDLGISKIASILKNKPTSEIEKILKV